MFCPLAAPGNRHQPLAPTNTPAHPTVEAVVGLAPGAPAKVSAWTPVPGAQPLASPDDCFEAEAIAKADPGVRKLLEEVYGIQDVEMVACDPWSGGCRPCGGAAVSAGLGGGGWGCCRVSRAGRRDGEGVGGAGRLAQAGAPCAQCTDCVRALGTRLTAVACLAALDRRPPSFPPRPAPLMPQCTCRRWGAASSRPFRAPQTAVHLPPFGGRLIQTFLYRRSSAADNQYSKPLDAVPIVDLDLVRAVLTSR